MQVSDSPDARELLELLRRSPDTFWTPAAAAAASGMTAEAAADAMDLLDRHGLVERARHTTAFRYTGPGP